MKATILFRPSELSALTPNARGKSNLEKYNELQELFDKCQTEYDGLKNNKTKTAQKLMDRIVDYCLKLDELEPMKDLPNLSEGVKKHLRGKMIEIKFGRYKEFDNKYTTKGKACEEQAITIYSLIKGRIFENNKQRVRNDYFSGEIDLPWYNQQKIMTDITDIKNSYSIHTFFDNIDTIKTENKYQGIGYLDLYPTVERYHIANVLVDNTPDAILTELHRESYKWQDGDTPNWRELEILKSHIFTKEVFDEFVHMRGCIPNEEKSKKVYDSFVELQREERLIEHTFTREDVQDEIVSLKKRLDECRLYMKMIYGIEHVPVNN